METGVSQHAMFSRWKASPFREDSRSADFVLHHVSAAPVPGAVLAGVARRGACGADLGRGGLPHRFGFGGAEQCEPDPTAAVLAGAESGGEPVALLACASLVEPPVPGLRRVAGGGGQESVCCPRRHGNDQDCLQCSIYLKERMKLPESVL